jgi:hypothetical protein
MSWIHTTRCVGLRVMVVGVLVASPLIGLAQQSRPPLSQETSALQVLSPKDGERVPRRRGSTLPRARPLHQTACRGACRA